MWMFIVACDAECLHIQILCCIYIYAVCNVVILLMLLIVLQHFQFARELTDVHIFQMQVLLLSSSCAVDKECRLTHAIAK